jgi:hypothetical protein
MLAAPQLAIPMTPLPDRLFLHFRPDPRNPSLPFPHPNIQIRLRDPTRCTEKMDVVWQENITPYNPLPIGLPGGKHRIHRRSTREKRSPFLRTNRHKQNAGTIVAFMRQVRARPPAHWQNRLRGGIHAVDEKQTPAALTSRTLLARRDGAPPHKMPRTIKKHCTRLAQEGPGSQVRRGPCKHADPALTSSALLAMRCVEIYEQTQRTSKNSLLIRPETTGGWGGIRTPVALRQTRFPGVRIRPLCHPSQHWRESGDSQESSQWQRPAPIKTHPPARHAPEHFEKTNPWRRRESNPCPSNDPHNLLHV